MRDPRGRKIHYNKSSCAHVCIGHLEFRQDPQAANDLLDSLGAIRLSISIEAEIRENVLLGGLKSLVVFTMPKYDFDIPRQLFSEEGKSPGEATRSWRSGPNGAR